MSEDTEAPVNPVSANPAQVEWPTDQWGMTAELRKSGLRAAGSCRGNQEKLDLFLATLRVLAQHALARLESDRAELADQLAALDEAQKNGARVYTKGVAPVAELQAAAPAEAPVPVEPAPAE